MNEKSQDDSRAEAASDTFKLLFFVLLVITSIIIAYYFWNNGLVIFSVFIYLSTGLMLFSSAIYYKSKNENYIDLCLRLTSFLARSFGFILVSITAYSLWIYQNIDQNAITDNLVQFNFLGDVIEIKPVGILFIALICFVILIFSFLANTVINFLWANPLKRKIGN